MLSLCRKFGACALAALWLGGTGRAILAADEPRWYGDIQYLTWDVRADEAEAARAAGGDGTVYLQPSEEVRDLGWYESCGQEEGRVRAIGALPRQLVGAFTQLVGKSVSHGRSILTGAAGREAQSSDSATTYTALRPISISDRVAR